MISLDPSLPYIYAPAADWDILSNQIKESTNEIEVICNETECYFPKNCSSVYLLTESKLSFSIIDTDADFKTVQIPFQRLLIQTTLTKCTFGLFKSSLPDASTWHMGIPFFKEYYVVYDMTPFDERKQQFISVGIAPKNPLFAGIGNETIPAEEEKPPQVPEEKPINPN